MNKAAIQKLEEDPAALKRWLTARFGPLSTIKEGPGVFVTTAQRDLRIGNDDKSNVLGRMVRRVEGDGKTAEASVRDFYTIAKGIRDGQHLLVGNNDKRMVWTAGLELKHVS